jgi:type IV pilus assembly protein PilV
MKQQNGFSMIEVLVTIILLAFGLLGLAGLQAKTMNLEMESYQRAQALVLLSDMVSRLESNIVAGDTYLTASPLGTGDSELSSCTGLAAGAARYDCEWSNMLKGAAESNNSVNLGAMTGARGCITQIQAPNPASGFCIPGIYEIAVTWQGMFATIAPSNACAEDLYGNDALRRAITLRVAVATTGCVL